MVSADPAGERLAGRADWSYPTLPRQDTALRSCGRGMVGRPGEPHSSDRTLTKGPIFADAAGGRLGGSLKCVHPTVRRFAVDFLRCGRGVVGWPTELFNLTVRRQTLIIADAAGGRLGGRATYSHPATWRQEADFRRLPGGGWVAGRTALIRPRALIRPLNRLLSPERLVGWRPIIADSAGGWLGSRSHSIHPTVR